MRDLNTIIAEIRADFADGDQLVDRMYVEMLLDDIERLRSALEVAVDDARVYRAALEDVLCDYEAYDYNPDTGEWDVPLHSPEILKGAREALREVE